MVLIGSRRSVRRGSGNILLGREDSPPDASEPSQKTARRCEVSARCFSVIDMMGSLDAELSQDTADHHMHRCASLCEEGIHAFLLAVPLGALTDEDKAGMEWLRRSFGERALAFTMILFTYEREEEQDTIVDDLKNNTVLEQLLEKCGGRYHTCSNAMSNPSEIAVLLERIDSMLSENTQRCYTWDMCNIEKREKEQSPPPVEHCSEPDGGKPVSGDNGEHSDNNELEDKAMLSESHEPLEELSKTRHKDTEVEELMHRLHLEDKHHAKLTTADFLTISSLSLHQHEPQEEKELAFAFLQKLLMLDYRARYTTIKHEIHGNANIASETVGAEESAFNALFSKNPPTDNQADKNTHIHPMDIQMAVFHCADSFLKQYMVTKLSLCQYALPLLVPNPFTPEIECPLWTFRQITKSWKSTDVDNVVTSRCMPIYKAETPMVFAFRLGSVSCSKSQLLNGLFNQRHSTFFHRHCPGSSKKRLLMDGVVEIAWYCPAGKPTDNFENCIAFCNLHGDAEDSEKQREVLTRAASVNIVLLPGLSQEDRRMGIVEELFHSPKPLICLLAEDNSAVTQVSPGKFKMGLKDRNQSDISEELTKTIRGSMSKSCQRFKLMDVAKHFRADEDDEDCRKGMECALKMKKLFEGIAPYKIKEKFLPCQGKLWHDWCQKNKDLYRLQGNVEKHKSSIQEDMKEIRRQQRESGQSDLMKLFVGNLLSLTSDQRTYFLKWVGILLDDCSSDKLSDLHHNRQKELEHISEQLNAATFGLEHILREMGQIYESWQCQPGRSKPKLNITAFPEMAAEIMISGYPVELMDGDAAHVPLRWIDAVLDKVIEKLGDKRVFVLSVLGIQSTGKSTMLNAMFGLQFAVSAGRCTRGAFMQLVSLSEEMTAKLNFDYVLVVDTEGLRALELAGKATLHHDNELATFVIGVGNMTLINIFGENPAEMQDILQIAVQAFLRMKKVKLSPSCVFVHQNVGDITAGEKNMEGKRRLQEKLDDMTRLAAKEEMCDVECFSDVIAFDIQRDVKYFAQLWEGSPPMAPPNPCYSESIQDLKKTILSKSSKPGGVTLSQFKRRIHDLWNALLNENFVFSFKNTLEIAAYRKLEVQYTEWTWKLRSAMLHIENKLQNRIDNEKLETVETNFLMQGIKGCYEDVEKSMKQYFKDDRDKEVLVQWRGKFEYKIKELRDDLVKGTKRKLEEVAQQKAARKNLDEKRTQYENMLFNKSKELAINLKHKAKDEKELKREFDSVWKVWVSDLTKGTTSITDKNIWDDVQRILTEVHECSLVYNQMECASFKDICHKGDYSQYVSLKKHHDLSNTREVSEDASAESIRGLIQDIERHTEILVKEKPVAEMGYNDSYIQEVLNYVQRRVKEFESKSTRYAFKKEFMVDLSLYMCVIAERTFSEHHRAFRKANDALAYLEDKKSQYYRIFRSYCQGATSTTVFADFICSKLKPSILLSVYDKTAINVAEEMRASFPAFSGNRSNLEKHILRSLAEEENFNNFMAYIHNPRKYFQQFISNAVNKYLFEGKSSRILTMIKNNIKLKQHCVERAAETATAHVKRECADIHMWLKSFSNALTDELKFTESGLKGIDYRDITNFDFLLERLTEGMAKVISELNEVSSVNVEMFREKPDEILIRQLCRCCWVQCPFCKAICTNTMEGHPGDHSVPFHRTNGINGWKYRGTKYLCISFCTTSVASDKSFWSSDEKFPYKKYREAGPKYACWSITPDHSELPYWKWFVCRFQKDLEGYYKKTFQGSGEIPTAWRNFKKEDALKSLDELI
ncbi:interferon-induced very large GTPase 1-like [Megalops cyprinoides]|uniref:interferon-induced very large GTPase 1-like n=1 Tax=Megalops cyprinoides TaxID=118141 RepID=UPI0018652485|nr:interferon-induced very large GTPase 1-like [Megalops cyprinoides]